MKNRNWVNIKTGTIRYFRDKNDLKALALYIIIKRNFVNSTIYSYTPESLSQKVNASNYHIRKLVGKLKRHGLVYMEGNNLRAISFRELRDLRDSHSESESTLYIHRTDSLSVVTDKLMFSLFHKGVIKKQSHIVNFLDSLNKVEAIRDGRLGNKISRKEYLKITRSVKDGLGKLRNWYGPNWSATEGRVSDTVCGYRKIAEIIGVSQGSVKRFLQKMKDWGYIKGFSQYREELSMTADEIDCYGGFGYADKIGRVGFLYLDRLSNKVYLHSGTSICTR